MMTINVTGSLKTTVLHFWRKKTLSFFFLKLSLCDKANKCELDEKTHFI